MSWAACAAVPAAFSVQVMNPGAVQTASGIIYQGRCRAIPKYNEQQRWHFVGLTLIVFHSTCPSHLLQRVALELFH